MNNEKHSSRLVELRKKYKITQEELAAIADVSTNTIGLAETKKRPLNIEAASRIVEKYNVSFDWLYGLKEETNTNILEELINFFVFDKIILPIESEQNSFLTLKLSNELVEYLLEIDYIEKVNKEKELPKPAYDAWKQSVKDQYLKKIKELENTKEIKKTEYILFERKDNFADTVAYTIARNLLPDESAKRNFDKLNSDN